MPVEDRNDPRRVLDAQILRDVTAAFPFHSIVFPDFVHLPKLRRRNLAKAVGRGGVARDCVAPAVDDYKFVRHFTGVLTPFSDSEYMNACFWTRRLLKCLLEAFPEDIEPHGTPIHFGLRSFAP